MRCARLGPPILPRQLTRLRNNGRAALAWSLRITFAAIVSYVAGTLFFLGTQPLLAPLTAMLVVQVTPSRSSRAGSNGW